MKLSERQFEDELIDKLKDLKYEERLEIRDRSVMVPLSASVCLVPLKPNSRLRALTAELDQFASSHLER